MPCFRDSKLELEQLKFSFFLTSAGHLVCITTGVLFLNFNLTLGRCSGGVNDNEPGLTSGKQKNTVKQLKHEKNVKEDHGLYGSLFV